MDYIVNDQGIAPTSPRSISGAASDHSAREFRSLDLAADHSGEFSAIATNWPDMIRIDFAHFTDGRGFSLAKRLRRAGFSGQLRATGYLLPDQYPLLRRCGIDAVEIAIDAQDHDQQHLWEQSTNWRRFDFRSRLDF